MFSTPQLVFQEILGHKRPRYGSQAPGWSQDSLTLGRLNVESDSAPKAHYLAPLKAASLTPHGANVTPVRFIASARLDCLSGEA